MCRYMRPDAINEHLRRRKILSFAKHCRPFQILSAFSNTFPTLFQHFSNTFPHPSSASPHLHPKVWQQRGDDAFRWWGRPVSSMLLSFDLFWPPVDLCRFGVYQGDDILSSVGVIHLLNLNLATVFDPVEIVDTLLEFAVELPTPKEFDKYVHIFNMFDYIVWLYLYNSRYGGIIPDIVDSSGSPSSRLFSASMAWTFWIAEGSFQRTGNDRAVKVSRSQHYRHIMTYLWCLLHKHHQLQWLQIWVGRGATRLDDEAKDVIVSGSFATGSVRARLGHDCPQFFDIPEYSRSSWLMFFGISRGSW